MSISGFSPRLLMSPSPEAEALTMRLLKSQNQFLLHGVLASTVCLFLILLNILIDGMRTPWSVYPLVAWGAVVAAHWLLVEYFGARRGEERHRHLTEAWRMDSLQAEGEITEIKDLRRKLLAGASAARVVAR